MAEEHDESRSEDSSAELNDPKNPPQSVLRPEVRRAALMSYLGPLIALCVFVGVVLISWINLGPVSPYEPGERDAVGTVGNTRPGDVKPDPRFGSTIDELEYRGATEKGRDSTGIIDPKTRLTRLDTVRTIGTAGRYVDLDSVEVVSVDKDILWVSDDDSRLAVVAPAGLPALKSGAHVRVTGTTELDERGDVRIRASRISEK